MKKTIISFSLMVFTFSMITAQEDNYYGFNKGDFFISSAFSYSKSFNGQLFIQPSVGYFFTPNISLGVQSEFSANIGNNFDSFKSFGGGINGKYFFMPKNRLNLFTEVSLNYSKSTDGHPRFEHETEILNTTLSSGLNFFITKNLSVFMNLSLLEYNDSKTKFKPNDIVRGRSRRVRSIFEPNLEDLHFGILYRF